MLALATDIYINYIEAVSHNWSFAKPLLAELVQWKRVLVIFLTGAGVGVIATGVAWASSYAENRRVWAEIESKTWASIAARCSIIFTIISTLLVVATYVFFFTGINRGIDAFGLERVIP